MITEPCCQLVSLRYEEIGRKQCHDQSDQDRRNLLGEIAHGIDRRGADLTQKISHIASDLIDDIHDALLYIRRKTVIDNAQVLSDIGKIILRTVPDIRQCTDQSHDLID